MKKYLLLLPLAGLLLTGCKNNNDNNEGSVPVGPGLPAGGTEVDLKDQEKVTKAANKLADDIKISYASVMTGFEVKGNFKADEFSIIDQDLTLKGINLGYNFELKANNLDKKLSEYQLSVEVSNFSGQFAINEAIPTAKKIFEASNISFGIYLDKGIVYADFSNPAFKLFVKSVINYAVPAEKLDAVNTVVDPLLNKIKLVNLISDFGLDDEKLIPAVTDEMFLEMKTEILEGAKAITEGDKSPVGIVDYDQNALGLIIQTGKSDERMGENEEMTYSYKESTLLTGNVYFDKDGNLNKINLEEAIDNENKENGVISEKQKITASESLAFSYGTGDVEFPDFTAFADSNIIDVLMEILQSAANKITIVGVEDHNVMIAD